MLVSRQLVDLVLGFLGALLFCLSSCVKSWPIYLIWRAFEQHEDVQETTRKRKTKGRFWRVPVEREERGVRMGPKLWFCRHSRVLYCSSRPLPRFLCWGIDRCVRRKSKALDDTKRQMISYNRTAWRIVVGLDTKLFTNINQIPISPSEFRSQLWGISCLSPASLRKDLKLVSRKVYRCFLLESIQPCRMIFAARPKVAALM